MRRAAVVAVGILVIGCGSGQTPATTPPATPPVSTPAAIATEPVPTGTPGPSADQCKNVEGGAGANRCRGDLPAGTYTTYTLQPPLTSTVPDGWANWEDLPGNFLLLPPGAYLAGVNPGTSDYLGVYASVVQPGKCTGLPAQGVDQSFDAYVKWLTANPALRVTNRKDVNVGGLQGILVDVAMKAGKGDGCPDGAYADVYVGKTPSDLVHGVFAGYGLHLYLLRNDPRIVAIEIADAPNGGSNYDDWPKAADTVVATFRFDGS